MQIKKLTLAGMMVAVGVAGSHLIYIPIGIAKCFPVQHALNLLSAVLLGPAYGVAIAFSVSLLRNLLGTGTLLAFPGSMLGALLAALLYQKTRRISLAIAGELVGTALLGGLLAFPVTLYLLGRESTLFFFVGPFFFSSLSGVLIGALIFKGIQKWAPPMQ